MLQSTRRQAQAYCVCGCLYYLYAKYNRNIVSLRNILKNIYSLRRIFFYFFNLMKRCEGKLSLPCLYTRKCLCVSYLLMGKNTVNFPPPSVEVHFCVTPWNTFYQEPWLSQRTVPLHMCWNPHLAFRMISGSFVLMIQTAESALQFPILGDIRVVPGWGVSLTLHQECDYEHSWDLVW